jgi:hypothetical protein
VLPANLQELLPRFFDEARWFLDRHPHTAALLTSPLNVGPGGGRILSLVNPDKLRQMLGYMLNENEFLSKYGIRSLSCYHANHPYVFNTCGQEYRVGYVPGDSDSGMFGGNSNWRGPIWMPMQLMLIRGLTNQFAYLGPDFKVECPVGSGRQLNLLEVSQAIVRRLSRLFVRNREGRRPSQGSHSRWSDPYWRDHVLFYEYFHGDTGEGIGASHQTGWTGLIAFLMQSFTAIEPEMVLRRGMSGVMRASALAVQQANKPEAMQVAQVVHEQVAEKVVAQVIETVQQQVTEAVQHAEAEHLQEKVEEIVLEKVADAVQKMAEEVQQQNEQRVEEKKEIF